MLTKWNMKIRPTPILCKQAIYNDRWSLRGGVSGPQSSVIVMLMIRVTNESHNEKECFSKEIPFECQMVTKWNMKRRPTPTLRQQAIYVDLWPLGGRVRKHKYCALLRDQNW
jgi:hypothetical protein